MRFVLASFCLAGISAASAATVTITTSVSCSIIDIGMVTDPNSCSLTGLTDPIPFALPSVSKATASASLTIGSAGISTWSDSTISAIAEDNQIINCCGLVNSSSQSSMSVTLSTAGAVRPGFVTITNMETWALDTPGDGEGSFHWDIGSVSGGCSGRPSQATPSQPNCTSVGTNTFVFMLGTPFLLSEITLMQDQTSIAGENVDSSFATSALSFTFTDASGNPVQIFDPADAPEPATYGLAALGVLALTVRRGRG